MRSATAQIVRDAVNEEVERIGFWNETERQHYVATGTLADGRDVDMIRDVFERVSERTGVPVEGIRDMIHTLDYRTLGYRATVLWSVRRGQTARSEDA